MGLKLGRRCVLAVALDVSSNKINKNEESKRNRGESLKVKMKPIAADEMFPEGIDGIEDVS
jgi:hypothetical protein